MDSKQPTENDPSLEQANDSLLEKAETLIWALLDDEIEAADIKILEGLLKENEDVRQRYIQCVQLHTDLQDHFDPTDLAAKPTKSPVLGSLGDLRPGTDTLPIRE